MSRTLETIKKAYAMAASDVLLSEGVAIPEWEYLQPGYRQAFITMFVAASWSPETMEWELRPNLFPIGEADRASDVSERVNLNPSNPESNSNG